MLSGKTLIVLVIGIVLGLYVVPRVAPGVLR